MNTRARAEPARPKPPHPTFAYCRRDAKCNDLIRENLADDVAGQGNLGGQLEGRTCKLRSDCVAQDCVASFGLRERHGTPPTEDVIIAASEELWCELARLSPRGRCRPPVQSLLRLSVPHEPRFHIYVCLHILALRWTCRHLSCFVAVAARWRGLAGAGIRHRPEL